ncbi:MAG: nucleotide exchange factor GrpE [Candidatus Magasanikbacteria bacterium]|nr:nucleotide exchange factor GrpE [Candidatus Magasanikbacteria bacterium]
MSDDAQQMNNTNNQAADTESAKIEELSGVAQEQSSDMASEQFAGDNSGGVRADDLVKQVEEYLHGWRRAKADYENLKREVDRERKEMGMFARTMAVMDFIPIYDNFKKAAAHEPTLSESEEGKRFKQWMDGIQHIKSQFKEVLRQTGIEEISTVGTQFDPRVHEAVEEREDAGVPSGQIIAEVSGGYKIGERVLQAAKVIIAK